MTEALIKFENETAISKFTQDDFKAVASKSYLPRLQLITSQSEKGKGGEFPLNHYALISGSEYEDLGKDVDVLVLAWRPLAIDFDDDMLMSFNPQHAKFQDIQRRANEADSACMYGPQYLLYIPEVKKYATLFLGSKTARQQGDSMMARMHGAATVTSTMIETKKYKYMSILVKPCSTPFELPDKAEAYDEIRKFEDVPDVSAETVDEGQDEARVM